MEERPYLKPEEFILEDPDGVSHTYLLSNFDCVSGRRIGTQYPMTGLPKIGDYDRNEELMFLLMTFVGAKMANGHIIRLQTKELVMNHVPTMEMLAKIEMKMMEKNFSFFQDGKSFLFLDNLMQLLAKKFFEMLTLSSEQSSPQDLQPTTSSEQSTT